MATNSPAAKKTAAPAQAAKPAKTPRKPKGPSLTMAQKYELLSAVKLSPTNVPDASLAESLSKYFGRKITSAQIKGYRAEFGIASVPKPTTGDLISRIAALEAENASLRASADEASTV